MYRLAHSRNVIWHNVRSKHCPRLQADCACSWVSLHDMPHRIISKCLCSQCRIMPTSGLLAPKVSSMLHIMQALMCKDSCHALQCIPFSLHKAAMLFVRQYSHCAGEVAAYEETLPGLVRPSGLCCTPEGHLLVTSMDRKVRMTHHST